jgi:Ca2+-binding RTX toxin-like protein
VLGAGALNAIGNELGNRMTGNTLGNSFDGGLGNDTMVGGDGNDSYAVDATGDVVTEGSGASSGTDRVYAAISYTAAANIEEVQLDGSGSINATGNDLGNLLLGNAGNNVLNGGKGNDSLQGGDGDDTYVVDSAGDVVTESGTGTDLVQSGVNFTLGANLENLTLTGAAISGTGNELDNALLGNGAANSLSGGDGNDTLEGGAGNDTLVGGDGNDVFIVNALTDKVIEAAGEGTDEIRSTVSVSLSAAAAALTTPVDAASREHVENVTLLGATAINAIGNAANNVLTGGTGANSLDGGLGQDTLIGGTGSDIYVLDDENDVVIETGTAATELDTIRSTVSIDISANLGDNDVDAIEKIELLGSASLSAKGNALRNTLQGNVGNNTLDGGAGVDTMLGGAGDDTYYADNTADVATEAAGTMNGANDVVIASASYTLGLNIETLQLDGGDLNGTGNLGNNTLIGGSGNNVLDGRAGADSMAGGLGDDVYIVDNALDRVDESGGGGTDEVRSAVAIDLSSGAGVVVSNEQIEHVTLTGAANINATGNSQDNRLVGNTGKNLLVGGDGFDTLDGGAGVDTMNGGDGDFSDTYVVDAGDVIIDGGGADDTVESRVASYTLASNLEHLILAGAVASSGTGNAANNEITGNARNNLLTGLDGNDILDGGAGNDTMVGDSGDDTYYVDSLGDRVRDVVADGTDVIYSAVSISLSTAGVVEQASLGNIENLVLTGSAALDATGNASANTIFGNGGSNLIAGMGGGDSLVGGGGSDIVDYRWATAGVEVNLLGFAITNAGNDSIDGFQGVYGSNHNDTLTGSALDDTIRGGAGDDTLVGDDGVDTVDYSTSTASMTINLLTGGLMDDGLEGTDSIDGFESAIGGGGADTIILGTTSGSASGGAGNDQLFGDVGNDTLDGGAGADTMSGGDGNDTYIVDNTADVIIELDGEFEVVESSATYTLSGDLDVLRLTGSAAIHGTGNALDNEMYGTSGNNSLTGGEGDDTLDGGLGNDTLIGGDDGDTYVVNVAGDRVRELGTGGVDAIQSLVTITLGAAGVVELASLGNIENIELLGSAVINATGNAQNNTLTGNSAANVLDGGTGADEMNGLGGNDTYVVDNAADQVTENADEGVDTVRSTVSFTLGANVEHLVLLGAGALSGIGNDLDNSITGNAGANTLDGGAGDDTLTGGAGNDTYYTDGDDVLVEAANACTDTIETSAAAWTLALNFENLVFTSSAHSSGTGNAANNAITGFEGDDTLVGLAGNDTLDGGLGEDSLVGGLGDDFYVVYEPQDVIVELAGQGKDTVRSWIAYSLLGSEVENLELQGSADIDGSGSAIANLITGNVGANLLLGDAGNDTLNGGEGHDTLDGGVGVDALNGGAGDDWYIIDAVSEVKELGAGLTGGRDTVQASLNVTLAGGLANIEDVLLVGSANLNVIGSAAANNLSGNSGNNVLDGKEGADTLAGGTGDDRYLVDSASDVTTEEAGEGTDTVASSVTWELADNFEFLDLTGTAAINGGGNNAANRITGNAAVNLLDGSGGDDTLIGGGGADSLLGGTGDDTFVYDALDASVHGGDDVDTLQVAGLLPAAGLNLAALANLDDRFESIERFDLTGTGNNTLKFTAANLKDLADFAADNGTFTIDGNVGDTVESVSGNWQLQGIATIGDEFYVVYTDGDFTLQVNQDITQIIS